MFQNTCQQLRLGDCINWLEELSWTAGTAPSTPASLGVHIARKRRAPTAKELLLMVGSGAAFDLAMYKYFGAAYGELRLYMATNVFINVNRSADLGKVVFRGSKLIPALTVYGGAYYAGRKGMQYAQKKSAPGLLSSTYKQTRKTQTSRSGGFRNPISGV